MKIHRFLVWCWVCALKFHKPEKDEQFVRTVSTLLQYKFVLVVSTSSEIAWYERHWPELAVLLCYHFEKREAMSSPDITLFVSKVWQHLTICSLCSFLSPHCHCLQYPTKSVGEWLRWFSQTLNVNLTCCFSETTLYYLLGYLFLWLWRSNHIKSHTFFVQNIFSYSILHMLIGR